MKAVAYLDLLGFTDAVTRSAKEALSMLLSYNSILNIEILESQLHPSEGYEPQLRGLAKRNSTESFLDFLPFSDSIFVTSENCSDFLLQLGVFLEKSFQFTAQVYAHPENKQDPIAYHNVEIGVDDKGEISSKREPCRIPPALFRGGVAFGEVNPLKPTALIDGVRTEGHILIGDAVARCVGLEKMVKGPRIVFGKDVYNQLNDSARLYTRSLPEDSDYYELLWPGMKYILENPVEVEIDYFREIFTPAYNLWCYFKNNKVVNVHYERFIELIVASALKLYTHAGKRESAMQYIEKTIKGKFSSAEMTKIFGYLNIFQNN